MMIRILMIRMEKLLYLMIIMPIITIRRLSAFAALANACPGRRRMMILMIIMMIPMIRIAVILDDQHHNDEQACLLQRPWPTLVLASAKAPPQKPRGFPGPDAERRSSFGRLARLHRTCTFPIQYVQIFRVSSILVCLLGGGRIWSLVERLLHDSLQTKSQTSHPGSRIHRSSHLIIIVKRELAQS